MKLFLDTADIDEIRTIARWGVLDGVTTNPSLFARTTGRSYDEVLTEICTITSGPVSAEVIADDVEGMLKEGRHFAKIADNIVVKPLRQIFIAHAFLLDRRHGGSVGKLTLILIFCKVFRNEAPLRVRTAWVLYRRVHINAKRVSYASNTNVLIEGIVITVLG